MTLVLPPDDKGIVLRRETRIRTERRVRGSSLILPPDPEGWSEEEDSLAPAKMCCRRNANCCEQFTMGPLHEALQDLKGTFQKKDHDDQQRFLFNLMRDMVQEGQCQGRAIQWSLLGGPVCRGSWHSLTGWYAKRVDPILAAVKDGADGPLLTNEGGDQLVPKEVYPAQRIPQSTRS